MITMSKRLPADHGHRCHPIINSRMDRLIEAKTRKYIKANMKTWHLNQEEIDDITYAAIIGVHVYLNEICD